MICKNCGAQIDDHAAFCSVCGTKVAAETVAAPITGNGAPVQPNAYGAAYQNTQPVNNGAPYMNGQPVNGQAVNNGAPYMNGQPVNGQPMNNGMPYQNGYNPYGYQNTAPAKKKKTGLVIGIIAAAIVVIAVVLFCILGSGNRSYKAAIKQYMNGIMKHDLSTMAETIAPFYQDEWLEERLYWCDNEDEYWDSYDEDMEWYCGSNVKYRSYVIEEADRMDQKDLADVEDDLLAYDVRANVTDGYEVEVVLHVRGDYGNHDETLYLTVIEIKGKWYIYLWDM